MTDKVLSRACCIPDHRKSTNRSSVCGDVTTVPVGSGVTAPRTNTTTIGGDWFKMGCNYSPHPEDGEGPVRSVWVDQFSLATTAVSNLDFHRFIEATNYQTDAEQAGSSFVFHLFTETKQTAPVSAVAPWWRDVSGACWHAPEGSGTTIEDRWDHPVVHITRDDALHYCRWSGTRLATEAEWEFAARGGLESQPYPWGAELLSHGRHQCNIWQGDFPNTNTGCDGYTSTAPVNAYRPNHYSLYNMTGNVWEWVADRFTHMHSPRPVKNAAGPLNGDRYVAKGGSYLCHESYCLRYKTSSRQALVPGVSAGNLGFRVAVDVSGRSNTGN